MTREEAEKIAAILLTADGGCSVCIENICDVANEAALGWKFTYVKDRRYYLPEQDPDKILVEPTA